MGVDFKAIPGHPSYRVGRDGTFQKWLAGSKRWKTLKPLWTAGNYYVDVGPKGARERLRLSALVLSLFVGPRPIRHDPLHFPDPGRRNCRAENLRWAPIGAAQAGGLKQIPNLPRHQKGSASHPNAVLTPDEVRRARDLYRDGWYARDVAEELGVSTASVLNLLKGKTYADVPDPLGPVKVRTRGSPGGLNPAAEFSEEQAREAKRLLAEGRTRAEVAEAMGCGWSRVDAIYKGRTWKHL